MVASEYPVTFPYGAQDGTYYGPRGSVGLYHRGDDRACPQGTPVVVNGVQIGLTGNTGASSGPHLHLGKFINGKDVNPNGQGFNLPAPASVADVGYDSLNGNYVAITDNSGARWVYLHLSEQSVVKGQLIQEEEVSKFTKEDYLVAAQAVGTEFGKDFDFDPNRSNDEFVQLILGQSTVPQLRAKVAELSQVVDDQARQLESVKAQSSDNTKWQTLKALVRELIGS